MAFYPFSQQRVNFWVKLVTWSISKWWNRQRGIQLWWAQLLPKDLQCRPCRTYHCSRDALDKSDWLRWPTSNKIQRYKIWRAFDFLCYCWINFVNWEAYLWPWPEKQFAFLYSINSPNFDIVRKGLSQSTAQLETFQSFGKGFNRTNGSNLAFDSVISVSDLYFSQQNLMKNIIFVYWRFSSSMICFHTTVIPVHTSLMAVGFGESWISLKVLLTTKIS